MGWETTGRKRRWLTQIWRRQCILCCCCSRLWLCSNCRHDGDTQSTPCPFGGWDPEHADTHHTPAAPGYHADFDASAPKAHFSVFWTQQKTNMRNHRSRLADIWNKGWKEIYRTILKCILTPSQLLVSVLKVISVLQSHWENPQYLKVLWWH